MGLGIVAQKREKMARQERRANFGANDRFAKTEKVVPATETTKPAYIGTKAQALALAAIPRDGVVVQQLPTAVARGLSRSIGREGKGRRSIDKRTYGDGTRYSPGKAPVSADALVWAATRTH